MYLNSGNKDTLYRIHGTNEPWTIGTNVSSGCIRLTNAGRPAYAVGIAHAHPSITDLLIVHHRIVDQDV
jgi:hypothetical protein